MFLSAIKQCSFLIQINERIIEKARKVHHIDMREEEHLVFLHETLAEDFRTFSKVDIEDWSLFKLATALKLMFDPHGGLKAGDAYKVNYNSFCKCFGSV